MNQKKSTTFERNQHKQKELKRNKKQTTLKESTINQNRSKSTNIDQYIPKEIKRNQTESK